MRLEARLTKAMIPLPLPLIRFWHCLPSGRTWQHQHSGADEPARGALRDPGVHVVDLKTGKPLYARDENRFFLPASNMKLFTTSMALLKLGADYRCEARARRRASGNDAGRLGDPARQCRIAGSATDGHTLRAIEEMAQQAVSNGLTHVHGNIVATIKLLVSRANWTRRMTRPANQELTSAR